jgi:sRNA-binding protein
MPETSQPESPTPAAPATPAQAPELSPDECAARLAELFPALFATTPDTPPRPIKLRIHADIAQRAPGVFSRRCLSLFLQRHTTSTAYLKSLVASPQRFDLDGVQAGEVSQEHRAAAQAELDRRRAIVQARHAAQRRVDQPRDRPRAEPTQPARRAERPQRPRHAAGQAADAPPPQPRASHGTDTPPQRRPSQPDDAPPPGDDPGRRERALLLRAYETTTLSRANFCALKRIDPAALDSLLEQARREAASK